MSDSNFFTNISETLKTPSDLVKAVAEPPAQQLGQSLADLFYIAFSPLTKKRAQIEQNIEIFKNEIGAEISKIDPEKIVEPKLSVAGPILDTAKFFVEEEELRHMFAKLIASSVNEDFKDSALPAFVGVITDLTSLDAQNLIYLKGIYEHSKHQVAGKIRIVVENDDSGMGRTVLENYIPFPEVNLGNYRYYAASIDNLVRLGLIQIQHGFEYSNKNVYDELKTHTFYSEILEDLKMYQENSNSNFDKYLKIEEGNWFFTEFGKLFIDICL